MAIHRGWQAHPNLWAFIMVLAVGARTAPGREGFAGLPLCQLQPGMVCRGDVLVPEVLSGLALRSIRLDDTKFLVAVAEEASRRAQGLMCLGSLGDLNGMLFMFPDEGSSDFWMKDTLIPLDIAFFDSRAVSWTDFEMERCKVPECPSYRPSGLY